MYAQKLKDVSATFSSQIFKRTAKSHYLLASFYNFQHIKYFAA